MPECQMANQIETRVTREESFRQDEVAHLAGCSSCRSLVSRAASLDRALSRAAGQMATAELPAGTLEIARRGQPAARRFVVAAIAAAAMLVALTAAGQAVLRPIFSDDSLRTDPAAVAAYEACLGEAGYTPRPIATGPQPLSDELLAYLRAHMECSVKSGIGEVDGDDPAEVEWNNAVANGITQCLRDVGWEIEPKLEPLGRYLVPPSGVISDDPVVQARFNRDLEACFSDWGFETE